MSETEAPEPDRVPGAPHPRETLGLFGQGQAVSRFEAAFLSGRLHHAWLFRGPRGVGKATLAYRIARRLIAMDAPGEGQPGNASLLEQPPNCLVLRRIQAGSEPNLFVLRRQVNPSTGRLRTQISVEDVRRLKATLSLSAPDGGWRVVLVDAADELNPAAANALLKILEEPPLRTVWLLISHMAAALLPTIRSRCLTLDLAPLAAPELAKALAGVGQEIAAADTDPMAALAAGSVGNALVLAAGGGLALYGDVIGALTASPDAARRTQIALANRVAARGAEQSYALAITLISTLLARMARHGSLTTYGPSPLEVEAGLFRRSASNHRQAVLWAEAALRTAEQTRHARAVNLDPWQTIMDTFLDLEATLARARRAA
ncbi:MAG: DNA polymerase III subunit delta' [Pseudomonadota bacterium]